MEKRSARETRERTWKKTLYYFGAFSRISRAKFLINHPGPDRSLYAFEYLERVFRDRGINIEYHITDPLVGLEILPANVDLAFG